MFLSALLCRQKCCHIFQWLMRVNYWGFISGGKNGSVRTPFLPPVAYIMPHTTSTSTMSTTTHTSYLESVYVYSCPGSVNYA